MSEQTIEQKKKIEKINPILRYFYVIVSMFRTNIRDYGMFIALVVIFILFTFTSNGIFLTPRNFTKLLDQTAYVAVLAVGMTLVIVTRQIDLSVGFISAFMASVVIVAVQQYMGGTEVAPWYFILQWIGIALLLTMFVGAVKGFFIAKVKVPSFVVTLAGMFIFKGLLMLRTDNTTIPTSNPFFQTIGTGYLFEDFTIGGYNIVAIIIGVLLILFIVFSTLMKRKKNENLGVENESKEIFLTKTILLIVVLGLVSYNLAAFNGVSVLFLITIAVLAVYFVFTTKSTLGRRIFAVGGNPEAAELSGIKVSNILIIVFISMGILSLFAGIMYASRVQNISPQHGVSWELYAIAATFIGGASAGGGVGKVVNSVIGAIVIMSIPNGLAVTPGSNANIEPIVLGTILLLAVVFDIYTRNVRPVDMVGMYYAKAFNQTKLENVKLELKKAQDGLKRAKEEGLELIQYEYAITNAQSKLSKIKNEIRIAKEEDFQDLIKTE